MLEQPEQTQNRDLPMTEVTATVFRAKKVQGVWIARIHGMDPLLKIPHWEWDRLDRERERERIQEEERQDRERQHERDRRRHLERNLERVHQLVTPAITPTTPLLPTTTLEANNTFTRIATGKSITANARTNVEANIATRRDTRLVSTTQPSRSKSPTTDRSDRPQGATVGAPRSQNSVLPVTGSKLGNSSNTDWRSPVSSVRQPGTSAAAASLITSAGRLTSQNPLSERSLPFHQYLRERLLLQYERDQAMQARSSNPNDTSSIRRESSSAAPTTSRVGSISLYPPGIEKYNRSAEQRTADLTTNSRAAAAGPILLSNSAMGSSSRAILGSQPFERSAMTSSAKQSPTSNRTPASNSVLPTTHPIFPPSYTSLAKASTSVASASSSPRATFSHPFFSANPPARTTHPESASRIGYARYFAPGSAFANLAREFHSSAIPPKPQSNANKESPPIASSSSRPIPPGSSRSGEIEKPPSVPTDHVKPPVTTTSASHVEPPVTSTPSVPATGDETPESKSQPVSKQKEKRKPGWKGYVLALESDLEAERNRPSDFDGPRSSSGRPLKRKLNDEEYERFVSR